MRAQCDVGVGSISVCQVCSEVPEPSIVSLPNECDPSYQVFCRFWRRGAPFHKRETVDVDLLEPSKQSSIVALLVHYCLVLHGGRIVDDVVD